MTINQNQIYDNFLKETNVNIDGEELQSELGRLDDRILS